MQPLSPNEQHSGEQAPLRAEPWADVGHRAAYYFGGKPEPVRFLSVTSDGSAVVAFVSDGRLDAVELHRVRLLP